jgi:Uma2 family endonuclease
MIAKPKSFRKLYSPADYLRLERPAHDKNVFIQGRIFAMPGGTLHHSRITGTIYRRIDEQLDNGQCFALTSDMRISIPAAGVFTYPDVSVVCGEPRFADEHRDVLLNPTVIVEVLSPSTRSYDVTIKLNHYSQCESLQNLAYVEQDCPRVTVHIRTAQNTWTSTIIEGLDAMLSLPAVAVTLPMAQIYHRVMFESDSTE